MFSRAPQKQFGAEARAWLAHATGVVARYLDLVPMRGATSSSLFLVRDARDEQRRFVLRVLDNREWLAEEPDLAAHEAAALREARKTGLSTPELLDFCEDKVLFGAPVVLMSHLPGHIELLPADFDGWIIALAETLARLHRHRAEGFAWRDRSWVAADTLGVPAWTKKPQLWEQAIALWQRGEPDYEPVFIHRDYHPVNVLWTKSTSKSTLSGVVDWINACRGPAPRDVAHCRINLAQMFGIAAADEFLNAYVRSGGEVYDRFWDVDAVLDMNLPEPEFYPPWAEFGMDVIAPETLQRRVDDYLESVLRR